MACAFWDVKGNMRRKKTYPFFSGRLLEMTAITLLDEPRTKGVHLTVEGEHLAVDAPRGILTDDVRQAIRQHKAALLALLAMPAAANDAAATALPLQEACP